LITLALKGIEKGTGPVRAIVPNILMVVSSYRPTSTTDGLRWQSLVLDGLH